MVRSFATIGFSLALVLSSAALMAQESKGKGRPRGGVAARGGLDMGQSRLALLRLEQVQTELKITKEQKEKIDEIQAALRQQPTLGNLRDLSKEDREKRVAEAREKREKAGAEAEKKLEGILKPEQTKRLDEIYLQQRGPQGLKDEAVVKALKLNEEQIGKINTALQWGQDEQRKVLQERAGRRVGPEVQAETREKMEKVRHEMETKVLAALTDSQKEQYEKMKGAPIKIDRSAIQGGAGGGQRGGRKQDGKAAGREARSGEKI